jgi:hypothetical protein
MTSIPTMPVTPTIVTPVEILYRYDAVATAPLLDEFENQMGSSGIALYLHRYQILKRTPKGVWIKTGWTDKDRKYVRLTARKRYASPTKEEAWESFIARKTRQASILYNQMMQAEAMTRLKPDRAINCTPW